MICEAEGKTSSQLMMPFLTSSFTVLPILHGICQVPDQIHAIRLCIRKRFLNAVNIGRNSILAESGGT